MSYELQSLAHEEERPEDYVEAIRRILWILLRRWQIIALAVAVSATCAAFRVAGRRPTYLASARLLVLQQGGRPVNVSDSGADVLHGMQSPGDSLQTQLLVVRSRAVAEKAVALARIPGARPETVISRLSATLPNEDANVLQLTYEGDTSDEASRMVRAVIESYELFLKENYQKSSHEVVKLIIKVRDELSEELSRLEAEYVEHRRKNLNSSTNDDGRTFIARRLDQWDQAASQAMIRIFDLESQLELGRQLEGEGVPSDFVHRALNQLGAMPNDPGTGGSATAGANAPVHPLERLQTELADVAFRRETSARLLAHLRDAMNNASSIRTADEPTVRKEFASDPIVAGLQAERERIQARLAQAERISRRESDPSITSLKKRSETLESRLEALWQQQRPLIIARLTQPPQDMIPQVEAELAMLTAKESALRERLLEMKTDRLHQLRAQHDSLAKSNGADDAQARRLLDEIRRLERSNDESIATTAESRSNTLIESIERSVGALHAMRAKIQARFDADLADAKAMEIGLLTEANLKSNLERRRAVFNSVVDQLKQAQLVSDFDNITAQTIDPPSVSVMMPRGSFTVMAALLIGLGIGGTTAYAADVFDARVRSIASVRRDLRLHLLGLIPELPRGRHADDARIPALACLNEPESALAESYRTVRATIEIIRRRMDFTSLLVTSPQAQDGKSTTASNLAISFAQAGRKVLLLDADLRRPTQHAARGLTRKLGLTDALDGLYTLDHVIQHTAVPGLDIVTAGTQSNRPAELLASGRLAALLLDARSIYDLVIVDSPPLLAVSDALTIAAHVDGVMLVARAGVTRMGHAERAVELLRSHGCAIMGAVVNGVTRETMNYGQAFGYAYSSAYRDEAAGAVECSKSAGTPMPNERQIAH